MAATMAARAKQAQEHGGDMDDENDDFWDDTALEQLDRVRPAPARARPPIVVSIRCLIFFTRTPQQLETMPEDMRDLDLDRLADAEDDDGVCFLRAPGVARHRPSSPVVSTWQLTGSAFHSLG